MVACRDDMEMQFARMILSVKDTCQDKERVTFVWFHNFWFLYNIQFEK